MIFYFFPWLFDFCCWFFYLFFIFLFSLDFLIISTRCFPVIYPSRIPFDFAWLFSSTWNHSKLSIYQLNNSNSENLRWMCNLNSPWIWDKDKVSEFQKSKTLRRYLWLMNVELSVFIQPWSIRALPPLTHLILCVGWNLLNK